MPAPLEIKIVSRPYSELGVREKRVFWRIHKAFYSATPTGFTQAHENNYKKMLGEQPASTAYVASLGGRPLATALVLENGGRWYSLAIDVREILALGFEKERRARVFESIYDALASKVIKEHPNAWGTVSAQHPERVKIFTSRHWRLAKTGREVLRSFAGAHPQHFFSFERRSEPVPHVAHSRVNSVNGPGYLQVTLVPKRAFRALAARGRRTAKK